MVVVKLDELMLPEPPTTLPPRGAEKTEDEVMVNNADMTTKIDLCNNTLLFTSLFLKNINLNLN